MSIRTVIFDLEYTDRGKVKKNAGQRAAKYRKLLLAQKLTFTECIAPAKEVLSADWWRYHDRMRMLNPQIKRIDISDNVVHVFEMA